MEALIAILIFIGGAILSAIQKRKQEKEGAEPWLPPMPRRDGTQPTRPSPPRQSPPSAPPTSWEEQLRRLLEGEPTKTVPPVVTKERRSSAPLPPPPPLPGPKQTSFRRPTPIPREIDESMDIGRPVQMPTLGQSSEAWQRGNQLEATVAERLRRVDQLVATHHSVQVLRAVPAELQQAMDLLRSRSSQRAAIVASIVLGPPKALET